MHNNDPHGFTIIELLVVITIIVVLLALLTPAMDKAIYQAELATCNARLRGIAMGAVVYASSHRRAYPRRRAFEIGEWKRANLMKYKDEADDLAPLRGFIDLEMLLDPLNAGLTRDDIDINVGLDADTSVYVNYAIFYDWGYLVPGGGRKSNRLGNGFAWDGKTYRVLAADWDLVALVRALNGHPGKVSQTGFFQVFRNTDVLVEKETLSRWVGLNVDLVDSSFAMDDGSVQRYIDVTLDDERLDKVPYASGDGKTTGYNSEAPRLDNYYLYYHYVPR